MTAEQLIEKEPKDLLKIEGFGLTKLKEVERVFYPSKLQKKQDSKRRPLLGKVRRKPML